VGLLAVRVVGALQIARRRGWLVGSLNQNIRFWPDPGALGDVPFVRAVIAFRERRYVKLSNPERVGLSHG